MVRTTAHPGQSAQVIRKELHTLDPTVAMSDVATLDQLINGSVGDRRIIFGLLGVFAIITVALAAVGTWGVVALSVADRRREVGLRMALGAEPGNLLCLVLRKSSWTALLGVTLGLGGAWAGTRLLETLLWETSRHDPVVFLAGSGFLFVVVLLSSYFPAKRATRVDPVLVLRGDE